MFESQNIKHHPIPLCPLLPPSLQTQLAALAAEADELQKLHVHLATQVRMLEV